MKRLLSCVTLLLLLLAGCASPKTAQVAATTLPVYEFTARICQGTDIAVTRLVTENVSCLHDYTVSVRQMRSVEGAELIVISGAGLEHFMEDLLEGKSLVDASAGMDLKEGEEHGVDPHIWLSPNMAAQMVARILEGLCAKYPQHRDIFTENARNLTDDLKKLRAYGEEILASLSCRELITFHDGFGYFADAFDLEILEAVEEEAGSEASASEIKHLVSLVKEHDLPAIFTERNGSNAAAKIISAETGAKVYALDMAMSGSSYFDAMYHNIDTIKEALG